MMGKTQRFSKGHSSGFVPDYRHVVETVGESDGFGSSGHVDSEDSSAPKRKCININMDRCNSFNVPSEVLSLSNMSKWERKALQLRLRDELEQVQIFQKKMCMKNVTGTNGVALSSSGDLHVKKHNLMSQNGSTLKRGNSGRFESAKQAPPPPSVGNSFILLMKQCETLLKRLMGHQHAWVFNTPVDVVKLNIPDYFQVIKHPMDLGTVKSKIASGSYDSPLDFVSDVRLTFSNAKTYNPPSNDVHTMADIMSKFFETRWKPIEKKMAAAHLDTKGDAGALNLVSQAKKRKTSPIIHDIVEPDITERKISDEEKRDLINHLQNIEEMPAQLVEFLRTHSDNVKQTDVDEVEIDVDSYSDEMLLELKKIVDDYLAGKQSGLNVKPGLGEMEILNESGLSNSSMHPCKGNDHADEDVDIVGNDPLVSSYPPMVIEKDTAPRNGKCSSSSSSSSDSGSSSSDSDSGSSSRSESDNKVSSPKKDVKEFGHGKNLDQERNDAMNPFDENRYSNGSNQQEQAAYLKSDAIETDCNREGGSAPTERQVSPDKIYRAALLKSRFADTILKAREKTLDQVEKKDPEKLRRDREELERLQREEKARLQAEAKAAEDARRQAAAEAAAHAAAEAKRKRELEREAARQALLQMEKSVEINENSLALMDLEMLRTAPGEQLPNSLGETSPSHSQECIGSFKLGGINPLEQLGLYMKVDDDDDDEEVETSCDPINDAEDGEVD